MIEIIPDHVINTVLLFFHTMLTASSTAFGIYSYISYYDIYCCKYFNFSCLEDFLIVFVYLVCAEYKIQTPPSKREKKVIIVLIKPYSVW